MANEAQVFRDEKRIHDFIDEHSALSETAVSLANKLNVDTRTARRVLDALVESGVLKRRAFEGHIEPIYFHYQAKAS